MLMSEEMRRFLDVHRVARLATASTEGHPHVVPFGYALVGDFIYFVIDDKPKRTHAELKHLQNIRANPQVALVVDDPDEFERVLSQLRLRYPQYVAMVLCFERNPLVRIPPEQIRLWHA